MEINLNLNPNLNRILLQEMSRIIVFLLLFSLTKTLNAIGQTIQSGVSSVRNKINDPNFQKDVKDKAEAGWNWLSSTAGSLWSAAVGAASQFTAELNGEPVNANNANNLKSSRPQMDGLGNSSKTQSVQSVQSVQSAKSPQSLNSTNHNSDIEEDDDDWMTRELAKAK